MSVKLSDPLAVFVAAVVRQFEFIAQGDARNGNNEARKYIAAARTLLSGGKTSIDRFATLLLHDHDDVRAMAAAYLLKERTDAAVAALKPIAAGRGLSALGAQMTLARYERGDLEIK